jgi:hypothetical protein
MVNAGQDLEARIRQWLGVAIVVALVDGLFWMARKHVETAAPARQRELVP